ncbi:MAG: translocation/assembly module TamB [Acidobacteria bacterium]|nr:MAG: translocation/assembly module TamB [Acidobacteriota bacterium]
MRRLIKIGLGVFLCLLIILIVGGLAFVESQSFDVWVRQEIKSYLERRFPMRVSLDSVDVKLLSGEFELSNFKIFSLNDLRQPAIHIDRILVNFTITRFFRPAASLDKLYLKSPRIRLVEEGNKRLNLANIFDPPSNKPKGKPFSITRLAIKRLDMVDGLILFYDDPIHVETREGGLDVAWRFEETPERRYTGTIDLSALDIAIADFRLDDATGKMAFHLYDNAIRLPSINIDSQQVDVQASGELSDLRAKVYRFETKVTADVPRIQHPNLGKYFDQGIALATGVFTGKGSDFVWQGRVESNLIEFMDFPLRRFESTVRMNAHSVEVERLRANLYTGTVTAKGSLRFGRKERSEFRVEASGVSLRPQLVQLELEEVGVQGTGDFSGVVGWPGTEFAQISGQGRAFYRGSFTGFFLNSQSEIRNSQSAAQNPQSAIPSPQSEIPFQGNSRVSFANERVRLRDGSISLPTSQIEYAGQITFQGVYDIDFVGNSQNAAELVQVARMIGVTPDEYIDKYDVDPRGAASFSARLYEEADAPHVTAQVKAYDIFVRKERLGNLQAGVNVGPGRVELQNVHLEAPEFRGELTAKLRTTETSRELNAVSLRVENLPIARFLPFVREGLPITGIASGTIDFHETSRDRYQGGGQVRVREAEVYGEDVGPVTAQVSFQGNRVLLQGVQAAVAEGTVTGEAVLNLDTQVATLDVQANGIALQSLEAVRTRSEATGVVSFSVQGEGSVKNPNFHIRATAPTLAIKEYTLEQVQLTADLKGRKATFEARNVFRGRPFEITGNVGIDKPYPIEAAVDLDQVPIEPYLALLRQDLPKLTGVVNGRMDLHGPLEQPDLLVGKADLSLLRLKVEDYEVQNTQPVQLSYQAGVLRIPPVTFKGPQTDFRVEGNISLKDRQAITVKADGTVNLALLSGFMPEGAAGGQLQLNAVVTGTISRPRIVGTAALREGIVTHPSLPTGFYDAEGQFKFTANQVSIDQFRARTGYGVINAEGGVFLQGFRPTRWQVNVSGSALRVEYPDNVISTVDVDLDALKSERSQLLSGVVYVRSAEYTESISIPELILAVTAPEVEKVQRGGEAGTAEETQLNISVEAYQSMRVSNNLADIVASGDFTIRGTLQNPVIVGSATIDDGELTLENNKFEITRGTVSFNNPRRTHPTLTFEATTEKLEHLITIAVRGPLERLNMSLRSEPPLPTSTIVSLLALNQTQEESALGGPTQRPVGSVAGTLLLKGLGETVEARASRLFGFEKFSIDPFFYAGSRDPGARVTLGKQLTADLTITYQTVLGNPSQEQFLSVEYRLTDWLTAIGTREENGSLAIDFKFRKRF